MRIALLPDDYLPDSTLVHAKMFHELALEFIARGHEVVVITPGEPSQPSRLIIDNIDGVEVWRFKNGQTRGVSKIKRAINETMLSFNAWRAIKRKVESRPFDACINYSPTIFFGPLVKRLKDRCNCYSYLILRDMFPQWVIDEGMIKEDSVIARYFRFFEKLNYDNSDCIGLMSEANVNYFNELYPDYNNLKILRNWADTKPLGRDLVGSNIRESLGLSNKIIFFYGGNIGHAQDMSNLLRLAQSMKAIPEAHFLFVGQGDEVDLVLSKKEEWGLDNLTFLPSVSQSEYRELLTQVDVGLFSLSRNHKAHNFPGKLLGYMVESLPILGSVNPGNDLIQFINDESAGFAYVNGEDDSLLNAAIMLLKNKSLRQNLGSSAHQVLHKHFSVQSAVSHLIDEINKR
ncbi:glycosyltransferase family 4 protein [Photobacterium atrarenae]|uniref:Glycosyltransferase family 4 protein n=1 Tax=Photobacterium atrarenae TaxID=865757 RepID=A0ABY5GDL7_9GAMM|nr:glycosyltransferase family 4 protein [Photobacterium atrarenae]UTV26966.1 glycosyltransferase family 4 protein [Photobacterium atrarenae]